MTGLPERGQAGDAATSPSDWCRLLDRLEERLRRIEAAALAGAVATDVELGSSPSRSDLPDGPPSADERLRLLALDAAHGRLVARLDGRRRALRQAQHYALDGA